jgi:hypothetical protein
MVDEVMEGLAGDNITDESEPHTCGGFCNLLEMLKCCFASASAHLWVETTTKVYFCKAMHLVWFLIKKNCKQGVKPKAKPKPKPKPQSKKGKELPEGTTDAPLSGKEEASDDIMFDVNLILMRVLHVIMLPIV